MTSNLLLATALTGLIGAGPAIAADACFSSSKTYQIHAIHGGVDKRDGWIVQGDAFSQCVHRAEAADKALRAHYPETVYSLSLAATVGCHSPC